MIWDSLPHFSNHLSITADSYCLSLTSTSPARCVPSHAAIGNLHLEGNVYFVPGDVLLYQLLRFGGSKGGTDVTFRTIAFTFLPCVEYYILPWVSEWFVLLHCSLFFWYLDGHSNHASSCFSSLYHCIREIGLGKRSQKLGHNHYWDVVSRVTWVPSLDHIFARCCFLYILTNFKLST